MKKIVPITTKQKIAFRTGEILAGAFLALLGASAAAIFAFILLLPVALAKWVLFG